MDAGRVDLACVSLKELLMMDVFGVPQNRLSGPAWMDARQFDISAKLPAGASQDQLPQMFQALLVDRFGLAFHREHKEQPVNALVLAKGGLKVKPAAPESSQPAWVAAAANSRTSSRGFIGGIRFRSISLPGPDGAPATILQTPSMGFVRRTNAGGVVHYEAPAITFEGLADLSVLAGNGLDPMVVDVTGAKGRYQVTLDISLTDLIAEIRAHPGDPSAVQDGQLRMVQDGLKKLGLQLEPRKAPVEIIVIDRLQKTPAQN